VVDFYCHQARLVVELDGVGHEDAKQYDADRDRALSALGLTVLRFTNAELAACLNAVTRNILDALNSAASASVTQPGAGKLLPSREEGSPLAGRWAPGIGPRV
jgi:very-short-patch-repair endonuclease